MKRGLFWIILAAGLLLGLGLGMTTKTTTSAIPHGAAIAPVTEMWAAELPRDPEAATQAYLARLSPETVTRSNAYFRGGYWLMLWNLAVTLGAAWLLLATGASAAMRNAAERITRRKLLQAALYTVQWSAVTWILALPLSVFGGFVREHGYGLTTQPFGPWIAESMVGLLVLTLFMAVVAPIIYGAIRRFPRTWWLWGTGVFMAFLVIAFMIEPVFISPLFNSYKPMTEGPLKQSILSMARANGVPVQDVSQFDASKQTNRISANVSGLFGTTAVRLNDNLLNRCTPAQVEGVMAHEIGHYVLNHLSKLLPFFGLLAVAAFAFLRWGLDRVVALRGEAWDLRGPSDLAGMPVLIALFMLFMTAATPVLNSVIRSQEIEADIFALNASQDPVAFADVELMLTEYRNPDPGPLEEFIFCDHPSPRNRIYNAMRWRAEHPGAERFSTSPGENPRGASH